MMTTCEMLSERSAYYVTVWVYGNRVASVSLETSVSCWWWWRHAKCWAKEVHTMWQYECMGFGAFPGVEVLFRWKDVTRETRVLRFDLNWLEIDVDPSATTQHIPSSKSFIDVLFGLHVFSNQILKPSTTTCTGYFNLLSGFFTEACFTAGAQTPT